MIHRHINTSISLAVILCISGCVTAPVHKRSGEIEQEPGFFERAGQGLSDVGASISDFFTRDTKVNQSRTRLNNAAANYRQAQALDRQFQNTKQQEQRAAENNVFDFLNKIQKSGIGKFIKQALTEEEDRAKKNGRPKPAFATIGTLARAFQLYNDVNPDNPFTPLDFATFRRTVAGQQALVKLGVVPCANYDGYCQ